MSRLLASERSAGDDQDESGIGPEVRFTQTPTARLITPEVGDTTDRLLVKFWSSSDDEATRSVALRRGADPDG